jgi:hypothetical protein
LCELLLVLFAAQVFDHRYLLPELDRLADSYRLIYYDQHIAEAIPNARIITLKGCGHFSYLECPVAVHQQIATFFATR